MTGFEKARALSLAVPASLMIGALGSQYVGGLHPCEMCEWQRWPHEVAIVLALFAFAVRGPVARRGLVALAAFAVLVSGAIGVFHAGVEYRWWEGLTQCSRMPGSGGAGDFMADIMKTPLVRCDQPQWTLGPISLAGFNAIFSIIGGLAILALLRRAR